MTYFLHCTESKTIAWECVCVYCLAYLFVFETKSCYVTLAGNSQNSSCLRFLSLVLKACASST